MSSSGLPPNHSKAVWSSAGYATTLSLRYLIAKMGMIKLFWGFSDVRCLTDIIANGKYYIKVTF